MNTQNPAHSRRDRIAQRGPPAGAPTDRLILQLAERVLGAERALDPGAPELRLLRVELAAGGRVVRALIGWTDTQLTRAEVQANLDTRRDALDGALARELGPRQAPSVQLLAFIPVERAGPA